LHDEPSQPSLKPLFSEEEHTVGILPDGR